MLDKKTYYNTTYLKNGYKYYACIGLLEVFEI